MCLNKSSNQSKQTELNYLQYTARLVHIDDKDETIKEILGTYLSSEEVHKRRCVSVHLLICHHVLLSYIPVIENTMIAGF